MYSFRVHALAICLVLGCFLSVAFGDVVHLKSEGRIEGKVIAQNETEVRVATKYGVVIVKREDIKEIEITPTAREIFKQKLTEIVEGDADAHYQLGLWCKEQGLDAEAQIEFREALKLKPGHQDARVEMGYVYYGGRWVHTDELKDLMEQKNFVAYKGRLISREEYDGLTAESEGAEETEEESTEEEIEEEPVKAEDPGVPWSDAYDVNTSHYTIRTNVGKKIFLRYKKLMEGLYSEYRKVFKGYKAKEKGKLSVWIYRNQQDFMQETGRRQDVGGYYDKQSKRVLSYKGTFGSGTTDSVLAREGCHQYLDSILPDMNAAPAWLVEGFAVYFESVKVSDSGSVKMGKLPRDRLIQLKAAIAQGNFITVDQLIRRSRNRFGPVEEAHAWSLIYFMKKSSSKYGKILSEFFDKCATSVPATGGAGGRGVGGRRGRSRTNFAADFEKLVGDVQAFQDGWKRFISSLSVPPAGDVKGDTFTSDTMGFEITKPSGWTFVNEGSAAGFQTGATKSNSRFEIFVYGNSSNQDAKAFATAYRSKLLRTYVTVELSEIVVNSLKAAQLVYSDENKRGRSSGTSATYKYRIVVIATTDRIYVISYKAFTSMYDADAPDFQKALESFKLTSK
jgi:hypothetical protein